ncbi:MAG: ATP-dependent Clp protease adapter ClpS [Planctomycetota bacterium]
MSRVLVTVLAATETETDTATKSRLGRPWNVIVHDDPITAMEYVTKIFMQVFGYAKAKAERLMLQVHNTGQAVVWTGARESAELHVQTLQGRHLTASLEPAHD